VATRVFFLTVLAAAVGFYYGYPWVAVMITLISVLAYWLYQLRRMQLWLQDPRQRPPDVYGIWGELLAQIYVHQRKNKEVQESLRSTVNYLQDSFASMRDGVVMVGEQGAIKWFNKAVEPLLGLRYPDDRGQTLTNLVRAPEFNAYFLGGDYTSPLEYCITGDVSLHLRVEITHFGHGARLLFVRDVTAAVRIEQIRRDFVGNVSHELRTPLTVITGYLGTFLTDTDGLPPQYHKALLQMEQQAQRMENLLKDLLWLSRIESEQREGKQELVNIGTLLEELRDEVAGVNPERKLDLALETNQGVYGDYRELYSAVSNLVNNAIKYSPQDSPVRVCWRQQGDSCLLSVHDRGMGIDSVHFPRLTERFYRVDESRSSTTGGTGIGLAIVKHVAAVHGARLQIESELGEGSTFTLVFPVRS